MPSVLDYSEDDISAKYITPALARAGWDEAQIRRQYSYAPGRVIVRGKLCDQIDADLDRSETNRTRLLDALLHEALSTDSPTKEAA